MNWHLFLDSDGVYADFEGGFKERFGREFKTTPAGIAWSLIYKNPDFYAELPKMKNADKLWEATSAYNRTVLTGCPTAGADAAATAKRYWWETNFQFQDVITCKAKDKPLHIKNPGDVLLDDHLKNVDAWTAAGGHGILHKRVDDSIILLNEKFQTTGEVVV